MDAALDTIDDRVITLDTTKAQESDVLTMLANVEYNSTTGVFTFTRKNGQTIEADLNIEKIPVSFSMDEDGVITMETSDGSTYTADVGSLIKNYVFSDGDEIDFTVTTDTSGNKVVTASIIDGSIEEEKLQPNFLADCRTAKAGAESANTAAQSASATAVAKALVSEGYANGTQNGVPVTSESEYYENNAHYWKEQAEAAVHSTATWGSITGTLANQTDLKNALDAKAAATDIPTKTSDLTNDGDGTNAFLTEHQSLAAYRTSSAQDAIDATKEDAPTILTATLTAGTTSVTFTDAAITSTAIVDFYTDVYGVAPTAVDDTTSGSLTLTFTAQESDVTVKAIIR